MTLSVVAACVLLVLVYSVRGSDDCPDMWDYQGAVLGPYQWSEVFPECGNTSQSPINIDTSKVHYDPSLETFDLEHYSFMPLYPSSYTMKLENVYGHTVALKFSDDPPVLIRGGGLPDYYVLDQLHFHWGSCNDSGSEHQINNQSEVMEMHIVHHKRTFFRDSSAQKPDGLAVLAFLFKLGSHNDDLEELLSYLKNVTYQHQQVTVKSFNLYYLLIKGLETSHYFYRYKGSLTTPPCYQSVIWSVFATKLEMSTKQLDAFRSLRGATGDDYVSDNYRPLQPLNSRLVYSNDPTYARSMLQPLLPFFSLHY